MEKVGKVLDEIQEFEVTIDIGRGNTTKRYEKGVLIEETLPIPYQSEEEYNNDRDEIANLIRKDLIK